MSLSLPSTRDVIDAVGPDSVKFLHAIVSQDIESMADGETRWSFLLTPQGRVVSHFRAVRVNAEHLSLDIEAGHGALLESSLRRYLIRTKCTLSLRADQIAWSFPNATAVETSSEDGRLVVDAHPLLGGAEVLGLTGPPSNAGDAEATEHRRVVSGLPAMGRELEDSTIPNGTGLLAWAVSFSKGCYIGQELVERIDSRSGTTPARIVRVALDVKPAPDLSASDQKRSLRITSVAPEGTSWAGLGWAARSVAVGDIVEGARVIAEVGTG